MATSGSDRSDAFAGKLLCADAAALFSASRLGEAVTAWRRALRHLLPRVTSGPAALDDPDGATPEASAHVPSARLRGELTVHPLSVDATSSHLASGDRTFAAYACAFQYHPSPRFAADLEDDIATAATSVFNLGVCHHLQALLHGDMATTCYEKALKAYDASQKILEAAGFLDGTSSSQPYAAPRHQALELLLLAVTNNVGHILDQLHAHDASHQQLELLHLRVASLSRATLVAEAADGLGAGPFAPFLLTTALHPCHNKACPHHAPCA